MMWCSFQLGMASGVPVTRMRFVPAGNTLTPSAMRCSSSSASLFAISAQRAGSSKNAICIMSRASLPLMGMQPSALRASNTRASARRFSLISPMAAPSASGVSVRPVTSSTSRANSAISPVHFSMSLGRFICGMSMT